MMLKQQAQGAGYGFGPRDAFVSTQMGPEGRPVVVKGAYRLEGNTLHVRPAGADRDFTVDVGLKGPLLYIGQPGAIQVLHKK